MKNIHLLAFIGFGILGFNSCELDNYDEPTASMYGSFIDSETGDLIESDIINGTEIELIEHGYENPTAIRLIVKVDGTYRRDMLFENTYSIPPIMGGNFVPQSDTATVEISGLTQYDFVVQPYIRLKDVEITVSGMAVTATFKLEQTVGNNVVDIGLFGHPEPNVGEPMRTGQKITSLNRAVDPNEELSLTLDLTRDRDYEAGKSYFFRLGALIDAPEAKYNYAPAVQLTLSSAK
jgi:hypothetical protein